MKCAVVFTALLVCFLAEANAQVHVSMPNAEIGTDSLLFIPVVLSGVEEHPGASAFSLQLGALPTGAIFVGHHSLNAATEMWGNTVSCVVERGFCNGFDSTARHPVVHSDTLMTLILDISDLASGDSLIIERFTLNDGFIASRPARISSFIHNKTSIPK